MKYFKSLRVRLFIYFLLLILTFVLFSLVMNSRFLKPYYMAMEKKQHIALSEDLSLLYTNDPEAFELQIERLERIGGYSVLILDTPQTRDFSDSLPGQPLPPHPPQNLPLLPEDISSSWIEEEGRLFLQRYDQRLNINILDMYSLLENEEILLISRPIDSMEDSVEIAARFFMITGLITLLLGSLAAYYIAGKFTKPIIELKAIALSMSRLDFSHKYSVSTRDEIGELGSSINSLSDQLSSSISHLREANSQLKKDIEKEREIELMRKEFISNVSHELKTPISIIQGYAEGLKQNIAEDEESKDFYCEVIIDEAAKMDRQVRELLELSQLESGHFRLDPTEFDLERLISETLKRFERQLAEKEVSVIFPVESGVLVYGDRHRIEQIMNNFLSNALNHVDEKKQIKIDLDDRSQGKIRLCIFNSGKKISEDDQSKIWDSYYKVDKARTRAYGGSGLGLSIVKAIQEKHGNLYGMRNENDGVTFWIDLSCSL